MNKKPETCSFGFDYKTGVELAYSADVGTASFLPLASATTIVRS